ncbi:MAG: hypothetical protein ACXWK4_09550, partial [Myxococcaceae bacterium]
CGSRNRFIAPTTFPVSGCSMGRAVAFPPDARASGQPRARRRLHPVRGHPPGAQGLHAVPGLGDITKAAGPPLGGLFK